MPFEHIVGNPHIKRYLSAMVENNTIAQSLLFSGSDGIGKSLFAEAFAKLIFTSVDPLGIHKHKLEAGVHPDLYVYRPEGKIGMHSIEAMRKLCDEVYLRPYEAERKVFIIHDAERMLTYSANALLKTFEEPAPHSIIILLSSSPKALLPTVLSRCRTVPFHALSDDEIAHLLEKRWSKSPEEAKVIAKHAQGSLGKASSLLESEGHVLRKSVLMLLSNGKMSAYSQIMEAAQALTAHIEQAQKQKEESLRTELAANYPDGLSSAQQQALDKEVDGVLSMSLIQEAHIIFDTILTWYRDLYLIRVKADFSYLRNGDSLPALEQALLRDEVLELERVQKLIAQAELMLARSTPLCNCLENLLLQLDLL